MGRPSGRHRAHRARSVPRAIALTLLSALFPGSGFVMGGRAKLGAFVMTLTTGLVGLGVFIAYTRREEVVQLAVDPNQLLVVTGVLVFLGLCWIAVIVSSHKLIRPATATAAGRAVGSGFVGLLCFAIAAPMAVATQSVMAQRDLIDSVFAGGNSKSATKPTGIDNKDPWAKTPRLNVLLLGADDGAGRDGTRTDTVMVASINTKTGDTKLISLSRNWMRMPFPEDSPLHEIYPDGFWDPNLGDAEQPDYYLDAMYRNVPNANPGVLGESDNEGADVLKLAVGEAVGLKMHYYMQVNLEGFESMIDALGGITVNVNHRVPIGGDYKGPGSGDDVLPSGYIMPGKDKKMMGKEALWFARGRYGLSDDSRQERQRCTIKALVDSAQPATLVTKYQQIASAGKKLLRTDIPQDILPSFVQLGLKVKNAKVASVDLEKKENFPNGRNPDYEAIREIVQKATGTKSGSTPTTSPSDSPTDQPTDEPSNSESPDSDPTTKPSRKPSSSATPAEDLEDACAYHPEGD